VDNLLAAATPLIQLAIAEDIGPGDATSQSTLPPNQPLRGYIRAKAAGVIAGLPVAEKVFQHVDPGIQFTAHVADGQEVVAGELVAQVIGPGVSLLAAERTMLNFLQRMSGIATLTRQFVDAVATSHTRILDTRKTLPGYRELDKYAVRMGGGVNHRMSLYDMLLIKDNHVDAAGGIQPAIERARDRYPDLPIEVEVRNLDELRQALATDPPLDRIMLDNMSLAEMRQSATLTAGRVPLEASGNVTLERAPQIAATGVDYISIGALTHSVPALDISMKITTGEDRQTPEEMGDRIQEIKTELGDRLVILGHHYQRDTVLRFADYRGDSLKLARDATGTDAEFILFCGVHFMAEVAAILAQPHQQVFIPDVAAGCYLADTATLDAVQAAWDALDQVLDNAEAELTPITYVNSSAALKAFCGRHGGLVCTSSNAGAALRWALERRPRVFFFPDQHLGRNTAARLGISSQDMLLWDRYQPPTTNEMRQARVVLWPGACNVHQRFRPQDVKRVRAQYPGIKVLVHPESQRAVVELADDAGSTAHIIQQIEAAASGTKWAVGTESRLVYRLQNQHPEQTILPLAQVAPFCATMSQTTLQNLMELLEGLVQGEPYNQVTIDAGTAHDARQALERMLDL
jgi:quinolinate synthase